MRKTPSRESGRAKTRRLKLGAQSWQLQAAKARFSEVFRLARTEGPQLITRQGKEGVGMMPVEQFDKLVNRSREAKALCANLHSSAWSSIWRETGTRGGTSICEQLSARNQLRFRTRPHSARA